MTANPNNPKTPPGNDPSSKSKGQNDPTSRNQGQGQQRDQGSRGQDQQRGGGSTGTTGKGEQPARKDSGQKPPLPQRNDPQSKDSKSQSGKSPMHNDPNSKGQGSRGTAGKPEKASKNELEMGDEPDDDDDEQAKQESGSRGLGNENPDRQGTEADKNRRTNR